MTSSAASVAFVHYEIVHIQRNNTDYESLEEESIK
jgi:hypothetical protein